MNAQASRRSPDRSHNWRFERSALVALALMTWAGATGPAVAQAYCPPPPDAAPELEVRFHCESGKSQGAVGPEAALSYRHPDEREALERIDRLRYELSAWGRVDFSVRLDPAFRYSHYPEGSPAQGLNTGFTLSAELDFDDPSPTVARTGASLERALRDLHLLRVRAVRDALLAHAGLLIAQEGLPSPAAQEGLLTAVVPHHRPPALAASQDGFALVAALSAEQPGDVRALLLGYDDAVDELDGAVELQAAMRSAAQYGLPARAFYAPLRFEVPDFAAASSPEALAGSPDAHLLSLELEEAVAELATFHAGFVDDLRVGVEYRWRQGRVTAEGGLINGSGRARLGLGSAGGPERWQIALSAQLVVSDSVSELAALEDEVSRAQAAVELYPAELRWELADAYSAAELAEYALTLAEAEVALLQRELETTEQPGGRLEASSRSARIRMYRAWMTYIRSVARVLELTGGEWTPRGLD